MEANDVEIKGFVYKTPPAGEELIMNVYQPAALNNSEPVPCVIFFFGGGWVGGSNKQFSHHARYVSERGIVGITAQYRTASTHGTGVNECVADGRSAVRWVREKASSMGIDAGRIVVAGGSAGGHVAACTELPDYADDPEDDLTVSCSPDFLMLFNPVLDTTEAGYGADKVGSDKTRLSPCHHVRPGMAEALIFHGTGDKTVPFENAKRFTALMEAAGNRCTLIPYDGRGHGFFNVPAQGFKQGSDEDYEDVVSRMDSWLVSKGIL